MDAAAHRQGEQLCATGANKEQEIVVGEGGNVVEVQVLDAAEGAGCGDAGEEARHVEVQGRRERERVHRVGVGAEHREQLVLPVFPA
jgi:hypothetical protein